MRTMKKRFKVHSSIHTFWLYCNGCQRVLSVLHILLFNLNVCRYLFEAVQGMAILSELYTIRS